MQTLSLRALQNIGMGLEAVGLDRNAATLADLRLQVSRLLHYAVGAEGEPWSSVLVQAGDVLMGVPPTRIFVGANDNTFVELPIVDLAHLQVGSSHPRIPQRQVNFIENGRIVTHEPGSGPAFFHFERGHLSSVRSNANRRFPGTFHGGVLDRMDQGLRLLHALPSGDIDVEPAVIIGSQAMWPKPVRSGDLLVPWDSATLWLPPHLPEPENAGLKTSSPDLIRYQVGLVMGFWEVPDAERIVFRFGGSHYSAIRRFDFKPFERPNASCEAFTICAKRSDGGLAYSVKQELLEALRLAGYPDGRAVLGQHYVEYGEAKYCTYYRKPDTGDDAWDIVLRFLQLYLFDPVGDRRLRTLDLSGAGRPHIVPTLRDLRPAIQSDASNLVAVVVEADGSVKPIFGALNTLPAPEPVRPLERPGTHSPEQTPAVRLVSFEGEKPKGWTDPWWKDGLGFTEIDLPGIGWVSLTFRPQTMRGTDWGWQGMLVLRIAEENRLEPLRKYLADMVATFPGDSGYWNLFSSSSRGGGEIMVIGANASYTPIQTQNWTSLLDGLRNHRR